MIEIPKDIRDEMVEHAMQGLPNEACGLLASEVRRIEVPRGSWTAAGGVPAWERGRPARMVRSGRDDSAGALV